MVGRNIRAAECGRRKLLTSWGPGNKEEPQTVARASVPLTSTSPVMHFLQLGPSLQVPPPADSLSKCLICPLGMSPQDPMVSSSACTDTDRVCVSHLLGVSNPVRLAITINHHKPLRDYNVPCSLWICVEGSAHDCLLFSTPSFWNWGASSHAWAVWQRNISRLFDLSCIQLKNFTQSLIMKTFY